MTTRKTFRLTDEQYAKLLDAWKPVPYIIVGGMPELRLQENVNAAWCALGEEMGFDGMSVQPVAGDERAFTAEPRTTP